MKVNNYFATIITSCKRVTNIKVITQLKNICYNQQTVKILLLKTSSLWKVAALFKLPCHLNKPSIELVITITAVFCLSAWKSIYPWQIISWPAIREHPGLTQIIFDHVSDPVTQLLSCKSDVVDPSVVKTQSFVMRKTAIKRLIHKIKVVGRLVIIRNQRSLTTLDNQFCLR